MEFLKKYRIFIGVMLVFSVVFLTLANHLLTPKTPSHLSKFYAPSDVNPELVDSTVQYISKYHTIADFAFTDQNGKIITQKDYENKIYVADFFFTTCGSICPKMTANLVDVQKAFSTNPNVKLLSYTVMPETDNVPTLKKYAVENGVDDQKWHLVTGDKKAIYTMARKSYLAVKQGKPDEMYDMVHTENFILVDTKKRVRGFYDGTDKDEVEKLIGDIQWLLENENK